MASKSIAVRNITVQSNRMRQLRPEVVHELAESIKKRGLLQPIIVRPKSKVEGYNLIAGYHRLQAVKELKEATIECRVLDGLIADEARLVEIDENLIRADLTPSERAVHHAERKALYLKLHPETKRGAAGGEATATKAKAKSQNETQPSKGKAKTKAYLTEAAKKTGKSRAAVAREVARGEKINQQALADLAGTCLDKGDELDAMAKLPGSEQRKLAARAKAGEKVSAKTVMKALKRAKREKELAAKISDLPEKKFGVILCDPGWKFKVRSEKGLDRSAENHYTCEELDVIKAQKVPSIASDDCVLFMWVTVPFLDKGIDVMRAWDFKYVSSLVGVKDKISTGYWFRNKHEIVLVGTKVDGKAVAPAPGTQFDSVFDFPVTKHSAKPEIVQEIIEKYFPNIPKIELNRRGPARPTWEAHGNEAEPASEPAAPKVKKAKAKKKAALKPTGAVPGVAPLGSFEARGIEPKAAKPKRSHSKKKPPAAPAVMDAVLSAAEAQEAVADAPKPISHPDPMLREVDEAPNGGHQTAE